MSQIRQIQLAQSRRWIVLMVGALIVTFAISRLMSSANWWNGRQSRLRELPYTLIVGPVDADRGLPGLLAVGMSRKDVLRSLGKPLIPRISAANAEKAGYIDTEDVACDLYEGLFAWVQYDAQQRVMVVTFDLQGFQKALKGEQKILLTLHGKPVLLESRLSRTHAASLISTILPGGIRFEGSDIAIPTKGVSLRFSQDGQQLKALTLADSEHGNHNLSCNSNNN